MEGNQPKIAIGMLAYNAEKYIDQAIESLLLQTYPDFTLVIASDCSTDGTDQIIARYAKQDRRIVYLRNKCRQGYGMNFRVAFNNAPKDMKYFASAGDHDRHHPMWLERLLAELEQNPELVMAYSQTVRIDEYGQLLEYVDPEYDNSGLTVEERIESLHTVKGFGNMIYGLFRADALRRNGIFPLHLYPDVLLLTQLMLEGNYKLVDEKLWFRRFPSNTDTVAMTKRQQQIVFAVPPWYAALPHPICHAIHLLYHTVLKPSAGTIARRRLGLKLTIAYWQGFYRKIRSCYPAFRPFYDGIATLPDKFRNMTAFVKNNWQSLWSGIRTRH